MSIADQLISRGWVQGTSIDEDGAVCLGWAINLEARKQLGVESESMRLDHSVCVDVMAAAMVATDYIERNFIQAPSLVYWNDEPGRIEDEVLRVAKQADEAIEALKSLGK